MTEADEARFSKHKQLAMSPQPVSLHGHTLPDHERASSRFAPLAQASTATMPLATTPLSDEASRAMRVQPGSSRLPGPRLGYFTEDRRESPILAPPSATRSSEIVLSMHAPGQHLPSDMNRMENIPSQAYMPGQPPQLLPTAHSRHSSLNQAPASPTRSELDLSSVHRDPFAQRQYYSLSGQPVGLSQQVRPVLSPVKDTPRPSVTPAPELNRQVPAKRSNIMSILNDEPEEPQPRKRFASEQTPSAPPVPTSASRTIYQSAGAMRPEETAIPSSQKSSGYSQSNPYQNSSRGYPEYPSYGPPGSSGTANNDWMARFDPRAQSTPQSQTQAAPSSQQGGRSAASGASQGPFSHYAQAPSQPSASSNNLAAPSPAPTPPPGSQRPYSAVFAQPTLGQGPAPAGPRDLPSQPSAYRTGSPPPRANGTAYGSRPEPPPTQSSSGIYGMSSRQSGTYSPATPSTPASAQPHSQSYQQHVQTLVNGSHRSTPVNLSGPPSQYGHSTPPPSAQGGRSMPPLTALGRSYTPPSALHPSVGGYAPPHSSTSGAVLPMHQRPPGGPVPLGETVSTPTHHRVYSHGSSSGGLPGSLHPSSQPPR